MGPFRVYQDLAIANEGKTFQTGFTDLLFFFRIARYIWNVPFVTEIS